MNEVESHRCAGGWQRVFSHDSEITGTPMKYGLYVPDRSPTGLLVYLSGLTCSEQNVITKGHFQAAAAEVGAVVLCPDTSPRGDQVPDVEAWDFGVGAGFYLDATETPWSKHFRMRSYVDALVGEIGAGLGPKGITGHSMGGHGALVLGLSQPERYTSISAFAPISAATQCPWGHKALGGYLGDDRADWVDHDAANVMERRGWERPVLVDQGTADGFLNEQLKPELLEAAARTSGTELVMRRQEGFDHSYYFVSSFLPEHVRWHAAQWG